MSTFFSTVEERFADWNYQTPKYLYALTRMLKPQVIVESGTYRGLSACWMAKGCQENNTGKVYCIDNFSLKEHVDRYGDPRTHLEGNLKACGIEGWVEILEGDADKVQWPSTVDLIYVDGWHSYEATMHDVLKAVGLGASVVALDDVENCVGPRMVSEILRSDLADKWDFMEFHSDNGLFVMQRKAPKRPITFSQELPLPNTGVDLRFMSREEQGWHFAEAAAITKLDYSGILDQTEHDREVGT